MAQPMGVGGETGFIQHCCQLGRLGGLPWPPAAWKGPSGGGRSSFWGMPTHLGLLEQGARWGHGQSPQGKRGGGDTPAHPFPLL